MKSPIPKKPRKEEFDQSPYDEQSVVVGLPELVLPVPVSDADNRSSRAGYTYP